MDNFFKMAVTVLFFCSGWASAQSGGKISGKAENTAHQPSEFAVVSLLLAKDKALIKTEITANDGSFEFNSLKPETYLLVIDAPGFTSYQSAPLVLTPEKHTIEMPSITLKSPDATNLAEVVIEKKKPIVEYKVDRTVVNVDAMMSSAGADAMEVLEKSPGIFIDQDGTITFKGKKGVTVFIDDKPTYLSGSDLEVYLKSLPASTLSQIEFMTNPPAKYEAAGTAGVINIKTRKTKSRGFNGSATSRVSKGKKGQGRNSLNLNFRDGKVRAYGSFGYADQESVTDLYIFRNYKNPDETTKTLFHQNTLMNRNNKNANARAGLDYYASEKTTWGISFTGLQQSGIEKSDGSSRLTNALGVLDSTIVADNREDKHFKNGGVTLNYSRDLKTGGKLTADADYLAYFDDTGQRYRNYIYQADNRLSSSDESRGKLPSKIGIYAFKTDYARPMKNDASFETGYKISYSKTDNVADYADIIGGNAIPNYNTSNHFKYDEMINAVYVNFSKSYKRFSFQTGLRLENTVSKGHQLGNVIKDPSTFKRDYTNFFPTVYLQYKLDSIGDNQLVASYGKRINRPYYQDLNPFLSPLDKFTFYLGNPYLNPSFSHNVELSYRFKSLFSTTLSYSKTRDDINETIEITNGIYYYSRPGNIGTSQYVSLNVQSDLELAKWFSTSLYGEVTHTDYQSRLYTENLNSSGTFFHISANNRFKIDKNWSAELGARYNSEVVSSQFTLGARGSVNAGIQRKILHDMGSLKLMVNDIFYGSINNGVIHNLNLTDATWKNRPDSRFVALAFTYSFGKRFEAKNEERSGAESEQNRVKS